MSYKNCTATINESGFTIAELLVGLTLFNIIALAIATFMAQGFQKLGLESRVTLASFELRNAISLMTEELKMSSSVSPYLPGIVPDVTKCTGALQVSSNSIRMVSATDNAGSSNGVDPYYVGYSYNSATQELRRGEIAMPSNLNCTLPAGDPSDSSNTYLIAERVVQIDANGDGVLEPVFSASGNQIFINLGVEATAPSGETVLQTVSTSVTTRIHS